MNATLSNSQLAINLQSSIVHESFNDCYLETVTLNTAINKFNRLGHTVFCGNNGYVIKNQNISNSYAVLIESDQDLERYLIKCFLAS